MKCGKIMIRNIIFVVLGALMVALGIAEVIDEFWSGMGAALIAVGAVRTVQLYRFRKDETYREKFETEMKDERNRFIRNKAWAWAGYLFIVMTAVATIALKVLGQDLLSKAAGFAVCLMMILYWICYLVLQKKY